MRTGFLAFALTAFAQPSHAPVVDRVDKTAFLQIEAESFRTLTPKQKALAYWLSRAAIAIDPIIYDQESRFGLRQKAVLEVVVSNKGTVRPVIYDRCSSSPSCFGETKAITTKGHLRKCMPAFTAEELKTR